MGQDSRPTGQGLPLSWTWFPTTSMEQAGKQLPPKTLSADTPGGPAPLSPSAFQESKAFSVLCLAAGLAISQTLGTLAPNL